MSLSPVQFMKQYRALRVAALIEDKQLRMTRPSVLAVSLGTNFLMNWKAGHARLASYKRVTGGGKHDAWFKQHKGRIRTAAMGKGAPRDYALALEWALRSGQIKQHTQTAVQAYCDANLGIDCSGFATNYLAAANKLAYAAATVRNTSAASYFKPAKAVNDLSRIERGDLLVWMKGNGALTSPGHIAVVDALR